MEPSLDALLDAPPDTLRGLAEQHAPHLPPGLDRDVLIAGILDASDPDNDWGAGVCEVHGEGFAFLRAPADQMLPGAHDIYLSPNQVRRMELVTGDTVIGRIRPPHASERYPAMLWVGAINGQPADRPRHSPITARVHPSVRLPIASDPWLSAVDQVAPLGLGARGAIVSPADAIRGELLRRLAACLAREDLLHVTVLLVGGRPEDLGTWMDVQGVEVVAIPATETDARQAGVADLVMARAARRADHGAEHVVLVDGLSRLMRAAIGDAEGGRDHGEPSAQQRLRGWLLTAGDRPDAGSVTLIATVDPAQDAHDAILHRELSDLQTWSLWLGPPVDGRPAIDVHRSGAHDPAALLDEAEHSRRQRWRADLPSDTAGARAALDALFTPRSA